MCSHSSMSKTEKHQTQWKCFKCVFADSGNTVFATGNNQIGMLLGISYKIKKIKIKHGIAEIEVEDYEDKNNTYEMKLSKENTRLNEIRIRNANLGENVRIYLVGDPENENSSVVTGFICNKCEVFLGDGYLVFENQS